MIATHGHSAWRHAACRKQRLNFPEGVRRSACVRCVDWHIGDNRAGSFTNPQLCQSRDVGAL
jgi:hypothetical protein